MPSPAELENTNLMQMDVDMNANCSEIEGDVPRVPSEQVTFADGISTSTSSTVSIANIAASSPTNSVADVAATSSVLSSVVTTSAISEPPFYRMRVGLKTLKEVSKEWKRGLDGGPAVEQLETQWKSKWRNGNGNGTDRK